MPVAGWDHDNDRLETVRKSFGLDRYSDVGELLAREDIQAWLWRPRRQNLPIFCHLFERRTRCFLTIYDFPPKTGGEQSIMGIQRLENEVLSVQPDLIILEYFINDACSVYPVPVVEQTARTILQRIIDAGAACMIVTVNGVNPLFTPFGAKRNLRLYHELYRTLVSEYNVAFVGGFNYFDNLHLYGKYFITELKGNKVNHSFGNEDYTWGPFDGELSNAILKELCRI